MTKELEEYKALVDETLDILDNTSILTCPEVDVSQQIKVLKKTAQALLRVIDALGDEKRDGGSVGFADGISVGFNALRQQIIDAILNTEKGN